MTNEDWLRIPSAKGRLGVEVTVRVALDAGRTNWEYIDEIVEKGREYGSAEVTAIVLLEDPVPKRRRT